MPLDGFALEVVEALFAKMNAEGAAIKAQMSAGASFENWMTWVLSQAFADHPDIQALPEVGYAGFGCMAANGVEPNRQRADLLVQRWPVQTQVLAEAALVLPATQSKWKGKIAHDYRKLQAVEPRAGLAKILLVYSASPWGAVVGVPAWDDWFAAIRVNGACLPQADFVATFPLGKGQCALQAWQVP